ncbi:MAG: sodium:alanine symporter family protein [Clostridia bacterium]|nr:sodium:alanine symporter family protein [Clostridia bacterium]
MALLSVLGGYFTVKCRLWRIGVKQILLLPFAQSGKKGGISSFAAAATAVGGTVGVGSIVGVGVAISVGGEGSVFWLLVCSLLCVGLKYAETSVALSAKGNKNGAGGAHCRLFALGYKKTALFFCLCCVAVSLTTGNLTQISAAAAALNGIGVEKALFGVISAILVGLAVFGGRGRIARVNAVIMPAAACIYLLACLAVILLNISQIPQALSAVIKNAFGFSAVAGGFSGGVMAKAVSEGFARSMFSTESGMGSSPLAHASADSADIATQAKWGIFEVAFDSFGVTALTALALLVSKKGDCLSAFYSSFGNIGTYAFAVLCAVFAFASVISWCYYAECCIPFIFKKSRRALLVYRVVFTLFALVGSLVPIKNLLYTADILNALMMLPNLLLLVLCRNEIEGME